MATFLFGASVIGFPVPLMWYTGGFVVGLYVPLMQLMAFGLEPFKKTSPCHRNLQRHIHYFNAYMALLNIFPLCKVLYDFVPVAYRSIAVIILPIWRLAAKQYMVRSTRDMEDFIPGIVAMSVDFFSALFVSVCMTTQSSMYLSMLFIAADIGQSVLEFQDVRANAGTVIDLLRDRHASSERLKMSSSKHLSLTSTLKFTRLVDLILEATRDPQAFHITSLKGVRLRACYHIGLHQNKKKNWTI
ncbi:unnamed protein product [Phytophthora lilii]|uniref:Unnamed protein product n=1 Tax=Phytophthora lilii TaxID=2077276 RepID=A0A9W6WSP3_9STRA|nr:unnamed protein product [Phytophthora lilii]